VNAPPRASRARASLPLRAGKTRIGKPGSCVPGLLQAMLLAPFAVAFASPLLWLIATAFHETGSLANAWTLGNFATLFRTLPFVQWLVNSLWLASVQTTLAVLLSSLGGFALAKYRFRGRRVVLSLMLVTLLLPGQVLLPSLYELMDAIGWVDSYAAILVPGAVSVVGLFLFRGAMAAVPDELLDAGRIDGCSELRLWWSVALPLVRPMVGAFTLMAFLGSWNSFLWPQVVLQDEAKYTLPIGLANLTGLPQYQADPGVLMAATLISILPVVLLFFVLQRDFVAGLGAGAVKE